jgi:hypothetical protein
LKRNLEVTQFTVELKFSGVGRAIGLDPRRVEPPVAALKKSRSQERPRRKWCLENPVPSVATRGFEDFWKGGSEPMILSKQKLCSVGPKRIYIFDCRKAIKLIPDNEWPAASRAVWS